LAREEVLPVAVHALLLEDLAPRLPGIQLIVGHELHVARRSRREPEFPLAGWLNGVLAQREVECPGGASLQHDRLRITGEARRADRHLVAPRHEMGGLVA